MERAALERKGVPEDVLKLVEKPAGERTRDQALQVARYFGSIAPELKPLRDRIAALEKARPLIPNLPVMVELAPAKRRVTRVLRKGNFLDPAETVTPGVPGALHPFPAGSPPDRLGLSRWLTDRRNPLTARVAVNRLWSQIFAIGLVETEEDFGTQGEPPSHPELLDWLAIFYQDSGWDTKALLRMIVTSETYRQSSKLTPELRERDPRNRLLARAPRLRLEAEMVRDQAMALSGLLARKLGGPSVYPPQPDGLWQAAFNGERTWATSQGADRYRRGLYTFWRRTIPYPSMAAFDAPSREICAIKTSAHQHAAPGVCHAERPGLRRDRSGTRAAHRPRGGLGRSRARTIWPRALPLPAARARADRTARRAFSMRNSSGSARIPEQRRVYRVMRPKGFPRERTRPRWRRGQRLPTCSSIWTGS